MKKLLLFASVACLAVQGYAAEDTSHPYEAAGFSGKTIRIQNHANSGYLTVQSGQLKNLANPDEAESTWFAEYDYRQKGVILSNGDNYIAAMPNTSGGEFQLTQNREEAGRYRFYMDQNFGTDNDKGYNITCTKYIDGTAVDVLGAFGAGGEAGKNHWMQGQNGNPATTPNGRVVRYGQPAENSHWHVTVTTDYSGQSAALQALLPEGKKVVRVTCGEDIEPGGKYVIAAHNILWEGNDRILLLQSNNNTIFSEISALTSLDNATWELTHNNGSFNPLAAINSEGNFRSLQPVEFTTEPRQYSVKQGDRYVDFDATSTVTAPDANGFNAQTIRFNHLTTIPGCDAYASDSDAAKQANTYDNEYNPCGFFMLNMQRGNAGSPNPSYATAYTNGTNYVFGAFSGGNWIYNLQGVASGNPINNFKNSRVSCMYILYRIVEDTESDEIRPVLEGVLDELNLPSILSNNPYFSAEVMETIRQNYPAPSLNDYSNYRAAANSIVEPPIVKIRAALNNQIVAIRCKVQSHGSNRGYLTATNTNILKHYTDFSPEALWRVVLKDDGHIELHGLAYNNYVNGCRCNADTPGSLTLFLTAANDGSFGFNTTDDDNLSSNHFLHNGNNDSNTNNVMLWSCAAGNGGSHYYLESVDADKIEIMKSAIQSQVDYLEGFAFGNVPGTYQEIDEFAESMVQAKAVAQGQFDIDAYFDAYRTIGNIRESMAIVPVEPGHYVSIKNMATGENSKYFAIGKPNANGSIADNTYTADFSADNIFYYTANHRLISFSRGTALNHSSANFLRNQTTAADHGSPSFGTDITFVEVPGIDGVIGKYFIRYNNASRTLYNNGDVVNGAGVISNASGDNIYYAMTVEYIDELPVAINSDGIGSIVSPVALQVPENTNGFEYYIAATEHRGGKHLINFSKKTAGEIIPAGSYVLINRAEIAPELQTVAYVKVAADNVAALAADVEEGNELFSASHLRLARTHSEEGSDVTYLIKESPETITYASADKVTFTKATADDTELEPHTLMVNVPKSEDAEAPATIALSLNGDNDSSTTSITEVNAEQPAAAALIYDLQGRKLNAPAKGVNIINGKKVMVK